MTVCLRLHTWIGIGVLCTVGAGCSRPSPDFLGARAADLGDCFEATLGAGGPIHVRLKFTDCFVMALGYAHANRNGWHGYRGGKQNWYGDLQILGGFPFIYNREEVRRLGNDDEPHSSAITWSSFVTRRTYARDDDNVLLIEPHPSDPYWVGLSLTRFISFTLGFNLAEFGDFAAGWFGGDPRGDDEIAPMQAGALAGASRQSADGSEEREAASHSSRCSSVGTAERRSSVDGWSSPSAASRGCEGTERSARCLVTGSDACSSWACVPW